MLKTSLLFKKFAKLHGKITGEFLRLRMQNFQDIVLYEYKHKGQFSNLQYCTSN